jgi:hypothetical protein
MRSGRHRRQTHLYHELLPYGNYSLCVTATIGTQARKYTTTFQNNTPAGPTVKVFLGNGTLASGCP